MRQLLTNRFVLLLGAVAIVSVILGIRSESGTKTGSVSIGSVAREDLVQRVTFSGSVTPNRKTVISAPYNGYVRQIFVQIGQKVKEGEPIVSVAQSLRGSSEDVYPLRAPFSGVVTQILKTEGEYVDLQNTQSATGSSIVRIDDLSHIFVEASAPEIDVSKLKVGQEAIIKSAAILTRTYKGKIDHISLAAKEQKDWDRSRVEFSIYIEITDADSQIKPGMSVIVDIVTNKANSVLTLRHEFIQKNGDKYFVVTDTGARKPIEVGLQNEEAFEIKTGVTEGEKIRQNDFLSLLKAQ